MTSNQLIICSS